MSKLEMSTSAGKPVEPSVEKTQHKPVDPKVFDPSMVIQDLVAQFKSLPKECQIQVDMFLDHYKRLIEKMDQYDWTDLFGQGVKLKDGGDIKTFIAQITRAPIELKVLYTEPEKPSEIRIAMHKNAHSLLVLKLRSLGKYVGPIGLDMTLGEGKDAVKVTNPLSLSYDEQSKLLRLVYT